MDSVEDLSVEELECLIEATVRRTLEDFLEERKALVSRRYLDSIEEAREDYRAGRTVPLRDRGNG